MAADTRESALPFWVPFVVVLVVSVLSFTAGQARGQANEREEWIREICNHDLGETVFDQRCDRWFPNE